MSLLAAQSEDWRARVQQAIQEQRLPEAMQLTESRLLSFPNDAEARGVHGRLLAWNGRWSEAEAEYRWVLARAPHDADILAGLADVLTWDGRLAEALSLLNQAMAEHRSSDLLLRRGKVLAGLLRRREAGDDYRAVLTMDPANRAARDALAGLREFKHELRFGGEADTYNRADAAGMQAIALRSRWSSRWATEFTVAMHQRFGVGVQRFRAQVDRRLGGSWISVSALHSTSGSLLARRELSLEGGHAFRVRHRFVRGLETSVQPRWLWFDGARVLVVSTSYLIYLPRDWEFLLTVRGARSSFRGAGVEWEPSGSARLAFPLPRGLRGNVSYGAGAENFSRAEQIGHFAARDFGGGLTAKLARAHEITLFAGRQLRSQGATQTSLGVSYAVRF